ncbi:MAG: hypothetical protein KGI84_04995, partial [Elusimicrobia bacterium]|nr:hypothetical protein [Elusimicrobiota bacterium]
AEIKMVSAKHFNEVLALALEEAPSGQRLPKAPRTAGPKAAKWMGEKPSIAPPNPPGGLS